jgi:hypothetical protein
MRRPDREQTCFLDYIELLRIFHDQGVEAVIVGGQAINFWAEAFQVEEPELQQYYPFTSADLDLHRPDLAVVKLLRAESDQVEKEADPFGKAFTIVSIPRLSTSLKTNYRDDT